ncbi:MAG: RHS repeat protein, partial [Lachnospiraceae bacterium]|nr:RHS repeat protein [Lachnospiraceae bacterium]
MKNTKSMRKIKQVVIGTAATVLAVAALSVNSTTSLATGNTYDTALEAAYGDTFKSVYNEKLAGSPLEAEAPDGVDTTNGHLILTRTDLSLEGTGGMDFELNRYYDSNEAIIGNPTVEAVDELVQNTVEIHYTTHDGDKKTIYVNTAILNKHQKALKDLVGSYTLGKVIHDGDIEEDTQRTIILSNEDFNVYGLASGWKFDLPWIETITIQDEDEDSWSARPAYLHFGSRGTMEIETTADTAKKCYPIQGLAGYSYTDVKLEDWDKEVDGIPCRYLLRDRTGLRTYFNKDGVVVLQKDAHDNAITYTYTDKIYLKEITDSVGRVIKFHYEEGDRMKHLASVTVEGTEVSGGVAKKTIKYTYDERSYTPLNSDTIHGLVLKSATVDGSKETYGYRIVERLMSTSGYGIASQRVSTNENYLINKVTADGSIQHYEYRASVIRGAKDESAGQERDVTVQGYYVTREYSEDEKTGKKSDGLKYDFFQKQNNKLLRFCDFEQNRNEIWQYGRAGLSTVAVVSSFNPNKYKSNGKMSDYTYKKEAIHTDTLRLKKNTKKNVSVYIYNSQKMMTEEVDYGKEKDETFYTYDNSGQGSLVTLETNKAYGKKGSSAVTTKQGYTYDSYRNVLTEKSPRAYLKKNSGKQALYTTTYTYQGTNAGYPLEDTPYSRCTLVTEESYTSANTKNRLVSTVASNGIDYASIYEQRSVNGGDYKTISKTDFQYDGKGNETQGKVYPSYSTDGEKEAIQNDYTYNSLGQQTKTTVTLISAKRPQDNRTYTEEEVTYDSFGNELSYTDEAGLITKTSYDPETGEETETVNAVGTEYESTDKEYISADGLKTMTVDEYGRVSISIQDGFGNTIVSKDEAAGTWTESTYDYGSEEGDSIEEDTDLEAEETARLLEERTYTFTPDEKRFIINENGETVPNFYITGKGKEILSGTKYFYDALGNEIGSATFSNGELDTAHCASWSFTKSESEVTGEEDEARTTSTSYSKELDPSAYQPEVDVDNYYDQFNGSVLTETITKTVTDAEGNTVSQTSTTIREKNKSETVTTYEADDFGRTIKENMTTKKYQDGKWLPAYETEVLYAYDENGNVSQTETKSRTEGESTWQSQVTKTDYNEQGQITKEYTPRGAKEDAATKYTYDILGQRIRSEIPQEKKDGGITYQTTTTEYDISGNVTAEEEQIDSDRAAKTEYTYDKRGNLVMVKNCMEDGRAQYVQYVYDIMGNKVRQFTGMTEPLTLTVSGVSDAASEKDVEDTFSYAGKTYALTVSGQKKSDNIRETKYEYDGKNQLVAFTDPEGRKETYRYDVNSNLIKTVDKSGNTLKNTYDYRNRLTEALAKKRETGEKTTHTYTYNAYGDVETQDDTRFEYGDVSGQVTKEITKLTKHKEVVKNYTYDSAGNKSGFTVKVGENTALSLAYQYDGASRLSSVKDKDGREVVHYAYDTDGNLSERTVAGNNLTTTYTYDYQNHLTAMKNQTGSAGVISEYNSEYLANGQKSKETSTVLGKEGKKEIKTAAYTYDLLGRITKETKTGSKDITYTYDSHNNRKEMTVGNKVTAYRYNKNDELLRTDTLNTDTEKDSVVIYKNDENGNQLAVVNRYEIPSDQKDSVYFDLDVTLGDNRLNENVVNHYNALNQLAETLTRNYKVSFTYDA